MITHLFYDIVELTSFYTKIILLIILHAYIL